MLRQCNILVADDGSTKLADIGTSFLPTPPDWSIENCGEAVRWMAPELTSTPEEMGWTDEKSGATTSSDVYSFGMTLLEVRAPSTTLI